MEKDSHPKGLPLEIGVLLVRSEELRGRFDLGDAGRFAVISTMSADGEVLAMRLPEAASLDPRMIKFDIKDTIVNRGLLIHKGRFVGVVTGMQLAYKAHFKAPLEWLPQGYVDRLNDAFRKANIVITPEGKPRIGKDD